MGYEGDLLVMVEKLLQRPLRDIYKGLKFMLTTSIVFLLFG